MEGDERAELEARLEALAQEMRASTEEALKKKREATGAEARQYVGAVLPIQTNAPALIEGEKVKLARGLDPKRDPTVVGRRTERGTYEFALPAELMQEFGEGAGQPRLSRRRRWAGFWVAAAVLGACGVFVAWWRQPPLKVAASFQWTVLPLALKPEDDGPSEEELDAIRLGAALAGMEAALSEAQSAPSAASAPKRPTPGAVSPRASTPKHQKKIELPVGAEPEY